LQWSGAPSREEPHTFFFVRAVNDFDLIICRGVIKRAATVLLEKLEKCLPPWVVEEWEDFLSEGFQLFDADRFDSLLDRLAPILRDLFDVEVFWFHIIKLIPNEAVPQTKRDVRVKEGVDWVARFSPEREPEYSRQAAVGP
jgi:hypothetical protein